MPDFSKLTVLLIEGSDRQIMPVMQSLHDLGVKMVTLNRSRLEFGCASRYPSVKCFLPPDAREEPAYCRHLLDLVEKHRIDLIIPLSDFTATVLSKHKDEFTPHVKVAVNDWEIFQRATDKQKTMLCCQQSGLPHPRTLVDVASADDVVRGNLGYPLVLKPRTASGSIGFHRIDSEEQLRRVFPEATAKNGPMLAQEYIPQTDIQYKCEVFIDSAGEVKSAVVFDKTRWYPIDGGSTCCSASVLRPDIVESSVRLLQSMGWRGYGDVDLIQDPRDHVAKIMEVNPRITASVKVCFAAGVDFARQILEDAMGEPVTPMMDYRPGRVLRYLHTDVLWFLQSPDRFRCKPSWFSWKNTTDQIFNPKDPWPFFAFSLRSLAMFGPEMKKRKR